MFGFAAEQLAQFRILGGDTHRTGIGVAFAHHHAADGDQHRGGEAEFLSSQQGADDYVAPGFELAVNLDPDAVAEVVEHQRLLSFSQAELPRQAGMFDRGERGSAGAAVVAADQHHVGMTFGNPGRHSSHADFRNQLNRNSGGGIGIFQVIDQLRQVFDRVDVVVRRRRNQGDAGHRMPDFGDYFIDLMARQLAAFAGLGALGDFDLEFAGIDQVFAGNAEPAAGDLFDGAAEAVIVRQGFVSFRVFAALPAVAHGTETVHGDGDSFMGFLADRAERHGAGDKPPDDLSRGFDFLQRDRIGFFELEQTAQRTQVFFLPVDVFRVFPVFLPVVAAHRLLECGDSFRRPEMRFAILAVVIAAACVEDFQCARFRLERLQVAGMSLHGNFFIADAADARSGAGKDVIYHLLIKPDRFKYLRAAVAPQRRDSHFRHDLENTFADRADIVFYRGCGIHFFQLVVLDQLGHGFQRQIGVDRSSAVSQQQNVMHDFTGFAGFQHQAGAGAESALAQMPVDGGDGHQRRNRRLSFAKPSVAEDDHALAASDGIFSFAGKLFYRGPQPSAVIAGVKSHPERGRLE